ncbi:MAG: Eco57I restriction-modification methylase domain-containing protein, partial [Thermosphaera sp.]
SVEPIVRVVIEKRAMSSPVSFFKTLGRVVGGPCDLSTLEEGELDACIGNVAGWKELAELAQRFAKASDKKLDALRRLLGMWKGKKVLVFTEYATTAEYLFQSLASGCKVVDSGEGFAKADCGNLGVMYATAKARERIDVNVEASLLASSFDTAVFISTDIVSEGVNLQMYDVVVNYEVVWSPTKHVQRVGRIWRFGQKADSVLVVDMVLSAGGERDEYAMYLDLLEKLYNISLKALPPQSYGEFEPATPQLEPESARDLLKRLYQQLVPEDIRHSLGEYYTPDWLADFLLDEVGLTRDYLEKLGSENPLKPLELRGLDPACGSGTFLVRYIARLRDYVREHYLEDIMLDYLLENVVGYDLNPLAVLTARTNYLLVIADLPRRGSIEIPIYLTDSLMVERRTTLTGSVYVLRTVAGEFQLPMGIVDKGLLSDILNEITSALRNRYSVEDFRNRVKYRFKDVSNDELKILGDLYKTLLKLEEEGKDDIWVSIIRNAFAPILKGKFDYIVGNPPWVNWENLPEAYRETSKILWSQYGLAEIKGKRGLGKVKRDLAMLFLVRCFDLYLKPGGRHGFLMPFTVFKTQAGAGFREFLARTFRLGPRIPPLSRFQVVSDF